MKKIIFILLLYINIYSLDSNAYFSISGIDLNAGLLQAGLSLMPVETGVNLNRFSLAIGIEPISFNIHFPQDEWKIPLYYNTPDPNPFYERDILTSITITNVDLITKYCLDRGYYNNFINTITSKTTIMIPTYFYLLSWVFLTATVPPVYFDISTKYPIIEHSISYKRKFKNYSLELATGINLCIKKDDYAYVAFFGVIKASIFEKTFTLKTLPSTKEENNFVAKNYNDTILKDFDKSKQPPYIEIGDIRFDDSDNNGVLDAGESGFIKITINNIGRGDAKNLKLFIYPLENYQNLYFQEGYEINEIVKNTTISIKIPIRAEEEIKNNILKFKIDIKEPYFGADADAKIISFSSKQMLPPDLNIVQFGIDDDTIGNSFGNSNGKIELGETFELTFIVQNLGEGSYENGKVKIIMPNDENIIYLGENSEFSLGTVEPGKWDSISVPIFVNKRFKSDGFTVKLDFDERRSNFAFADSLNISLNKTISNIDEIVLVKKTEEKKKFVIDEIPELVSDIDLDIPSTGKVNENAIGVIIGANDYHNVADVDFAVRDAVIMKEYLIKTFGFKEENIIFLTNPKKSDLEMVFGLKNKPEGQLYNWTKANESDIFVYYAGHGAPDLQTNDAYLVPVDANPSYLDIQGYSLQLLYENLSKIPARKKIIVIDACFSGLYDEGTLIADASPMLVKDIKIVPKNISDIENGVLITSSKSEEISSWYSEKKHSMFTYFFLKGLKGECDENKDGKITIKEIKKYTTDQVSYYSNRKYNRKQTPTFVGNDDFVILNLK